VRQISTFGLCGLFSLLCLRSGAQPLARLVEEASRPAAEQSRFVRDPICEEIRVFRHDVRQLYNSRDFNELEKIAAKLRATKARFGNGWWKIESFYDSLECRAEEPESMWRLHDQIHRDWIAKKPESISARVAYADFFCSYAWHARGSDYADRVTSEGGRLFQARLASAHKIVDEARKMKEKDPYLAMVALTVALGEGPDKAEYDAIVEEADAAEPSFWRYDTKRAFSLLPRWHGKPGDWEAFALKAAARPDGLGAEVYVRSVLNVENFYGNVFDESDVSWPKTREGLELMLKRYPESLEIVNLAARLAYMARDREMAQALFVRLNGTCVANAWRGPEQFLGAQKWAQKTDK
jgi:hypothetical protein